LDYGIKITLSKQISKELLYPIKLIFILLCADWSAWEFQEVILFSQNPADPNANLTLTTTNRCSTMTSWVADYGLKSRIPGEHMEIQSSLF
jgi:hypothetical protein